MAAGRSVSCQSTWPCPLEKGQFMYFGDGMPRARNAQAVTISTQTPVPPPVLAPSCATQVAPDITHVAAAYGALIFVCAVLGLRCHRDMCMD